MDVVKENMERVGVTDKGSRKWGLPQLKEEGL